MTITQTIDIPADHRVFFDFPIEIPVGKAQIELKVIPFIKKDGKNSSVKASKLRFSKKELDSILEKTPTPITDSLTGLLSGLGDITIEQIREERLAKYLK